MEHKGWRNLTLGAIAATEYGLVDGPFGSSLPASCYTADGIPVVRGTNLSLGESRFKMGDFVFVSEETAKRLARSICLPDDIIFTKKGTLGQTGIIPRGSRFPKFLLSSNQMKLTVSKDIADPLYVYYYVSSPVSREKIVRESTASGVPKINVAYLRLFPIVLPPLKEQQAIARVLGALDEKIELNRQMNRTLEALAQALFKSWFVDFDPVTARAAGRKPYGMKEETAELFPNRFVESDLGLLPEGWDVISLPEAFEINPTRFLARGLVAPYLDMQNMPTDTAQALDWTERPFGSGMRFINGDTLVARITPCLENGKTAYVDFLEECQVGWGSTEYIVLRSKSPFPLEYSYFLARWDDFRSHAIANMTGSSGRQRVPVNCLDTFYIVKPHPEVLKRFEATARHTLAMMKANVEQARTLAELRDAMLPKLLSGEIRVRQAENLVAEAV